MSLSKLCLLTTLVVIVACAAGQRFDVQTKEVDVRIPNSRSYHAAIARDEPLRASNLLVRSNLRFDAEDEAPHSVLLPVQSKNAADLGAGKILVASRDLADPNFAETVILLVRYDAQGVVGLILNRRTDIPLSRVLEQFEAAKGRSDLAYVGGPVETPAVFALLRSTAKLDGAEPVLSGVYLISSKSVFEKAIATRPDAGNLHVYLGYAGWSNDQLRMEVKLGSWFIFQGDARSVFDSDPHSLWRQMIEKTELQSAGSDPHALDRLDVKHQLGS